MFRRILFHPSILSFVKRRPAISYNGYMEHSHVSQVPLEVERKFNIPTDIQARLDCLHATLVKEVSYKDVYIDTEDNLLALTDMWLRRRNGRYQLKYAPPARICSDVVQYLETDEKHLIQELVSARIGSETDLDSLASFAEITTNRTEYKVGENIVIDLDETDLGYNIGEVETISQTSSTLQESVNEVNRIISLLGVEAVGQLDGKVIRYLSQHNKPLLDKIRSKLNF